ncbi:RNA polymerase III subunit RPC82 [Microdochium trichocladiopsis]|uniref:DNA-directed RNA polymerase III subunit RPC3 n=1 Tax=Microdochium trichocladiopsis TaxID=1682393 RepID=A0A9P9BVZ1_9PEZI|nr:RNA polymerase III subunit RPC82 [Microdochium trichocladiopsis]KAH7040080.1 RNA polymerase III subunit RPC82 [Microdochium trichocladiopsis]
MLVTKNAAELCVLLIGEFYGQLPSRVFSALIFKGRSTIAQIAQQTALPPRSVRHSLAVLIQQNAVYHHTDEDSSITHYEANADVAYNLVRIGKILETVQDCYGPAAKSIVHDILVLGHVKVSDLVATYEEKHGQTNGVNGHAHNGTNHMNGDDPFESDTEEESLSVADRVYNQVGRLLAYDILEVVVPTMFRSPQDDKTTIEQEVMAEPRFKGGVRGVRQTRDFDNAVHERMTEIHRERVALAQSLKTALYNEEHMAKRRKLANGASAENTFLSSARELISADPDIVIRINFDKCLVILRNRKLVAYAEDIIGETTAQVYACLLATLSKQISSCQEDPTAPKDAAYDHLRGAVVTTVEVFDNLGADIDVSSGLGKTEPGMVDIRYAEKLRRQPPKERKTMVLQDGEEWQGSDDDESYDNTEEGRVGMNGTQNGHKTPADAKEHFDDAGAIRTSRMRQMRQHLLVLAESKQGFVRHCGSQDRGEWTVDFHELFAHLRTMELDIIIEETFGRQALRLVRILREKGKVDDKTLPTLALMRKPDVHTKMVEMELAGVLDVQEVPRDNNRAANRTIFFWWFDKDRAFKRALDNTYKSMVRFLQRLEVERQKKKNVLMVTERKDVHGMEEEKLRGDIYNEYRAFLDIEAKLLSQLERLDDLVSVFRDF